MILPALASDPVSSFSSMEGSDFSFWSLSLEQETSRLTHTGLEECLQDGIINSGLVVMF